MNYLVTGAAGFIGSNIVRALNARGETNIVAVDNLEPSEKYRNLVGLEISDYLDKRDFISRLERGQFDDAFDVVIHQGACSNTMESNGRYMMENNYQYSVRLLEHCLGEDVRLLYASSAAVYGGTSGFSESPEFERPLNVYGYSKLLFDQIVRSRFQVANAQIAGLRYFNVYGSGEEHKGRMASVAWHFFNEYRENGFVQPFCGSGGYGDGEQRRDFVSVNDVVGVNLFLLDHPELSGIFNLGTGKAESFNSVASAVVNAFRRSEGKESLPTAELHRSGLIRYKPFPEALGGKYQHYTQADIGSLRRIGYRVEFSSVEQGVSQYVDRLLA